MEKNGINVQKNGIILSHKETKKEFTDVLLIPIFRIKFICLVKCGSFSLFLSYWLKNIFFKHKSV